jgi:hypothetical protein
MIPKGFRSTIVGPAVLLAVAWCGTAKADGFLVPAGRESLSAGSTVAVRWESPCEGGPFDEVELVLSLDGGLTFPVRVTAEMPPCASGFRWRVPALATTRGRLGLRVGEQGSPGPERIEVMSEPFEIVAGPELEPEELFRGASEWWTRQALAEIGAEDLLSESVRGEPERLVRSDARPDISEPGSFVLPLPAQSSGIASRPDAPHGRAVPPLARTRRSAPVPLRE